MGYVEIIGTIGRVLERPKITLEGFSVGRLVTAKKTERREFDGVHYLSSVHPQEDVYPLSCHFVPEGKEIAVTLNTLGFNHGRPGWLVGISDTKIIPTGKQESEVNQLVVLEGDNYCTEIHGSRIRLQDQNDINGDGRGPSFKRLFENIEINPTKSVAEIPVSRKKEKLPKRRKRREERPADLGRRGR